MDLLDCPFEIDVHPAARFFAHDQHPVCSANFHFLLFHFIQKQILSGKVYFQCNGKSRYHHLSSRLSGSSPADSSQPLDWWRLCWCHPGFSGWQADEGTQGNPQLQQSLLQKHPAEESPPEPPPLPGKPAQFPITTGVNISIVWLIDNLIWTSGFAVHLSWRVRYSWEPAPNLSWGRQAAQVLCNNFFDPTREV